MRYFTKEWYRTMERTYMHLMLRATRKADKFDEKYYQDLYKKELKEFLKLEKEVCEVTEEDVFDESDWDEISVMDEKGNLINVNEIMSEAEVEELRNDILANEKEAVENFEIEEYDEEKLTKQFEENHLDAIDYLKNNLPKEILEEVADIRVLALDKSSKNIKKKIEKYCNENEKIANKTMKSYEKYFETIQDKLPQKILEDYEFHDCEIISIDKVKDDIVFTLDNSGGFTDISKIIYRNGEILENNLEENSYWVYDEIYILDDGYEFHIGISSGEEYDYITLRCSDVDFE